jgi:hypothetical protein
LVAQLDAALDDTEVLIDHEFPERPAEHSIVQRAVDPFGKWLKAHGLNGAETRSVTRRLGAYFTLALHHEWAEHADEYGTLEAKLLEAQTPFAKASKLARAWLKNSAYLQRLIREPVPASSEIAGGGTCPVGQFSDREPISCAWRPKKMHERRKPRLVVNFNYVGALAASCFLAAGSQSRAGRRAMEGQAAALDGSSRVALEGCPHRLTGDRGLRQFGENFRYLLLIWRKSSLE